MRELRVEDALMYLDQVKIQFGDRPHIYNEFLHIMKTFKSQEIDTPGVILRVTRLFQGNKGLVLGFNTFLPDGYRIEIPDSVSGTVYYRTPFQQQLTPIHPIVLPSVGNRTENQFDPRLSNQQQQQQQQQQPQASLGTLGSNGGPSSAGGDYVNMQMQQQQQPTQQQQQPGHLMGGPLQGTSNGPHSSSHNSHPHGLPPQTQQPPQQQQQHHPHAPGLRHGNMMQNGLSQGQQVQVGFQQRPQGQKLSSEMPSHMQQQKQHPHLNMQYSGVAGGQVEKMHEVSSMHVPSQQQQAMQHSQIRSTGDIQMQQASKENVAVQPMQQKHPMMQHSQQQVEEPSPGPVEFDHAINYVTTIKKTFANDPDTYRKFLEILHTYQKEQRGIKDVLDEVSVLFADHPVLLKDFTYFLPDAVQQQAKIQLAQAVRQAESRRAALNSKQAIETQARQQRPAPPIQAPEPQDAQVWDASQPRKPFGVKEGRSELRERQICNSAVYGVVSFDPVRPPRKHELTPAQAAAKYGRPRTIPEVIVQPTTKEATFFERAKEHLMKKELASEKAAGSRKHTPYAEFLKCLHLYGGGILNKKELLSLLRTLFIQGHAPKSGANASGGSNNPKIASAASKLLKDFEKLLVARGPYARQQSFLKDKSKYGAITCKEWDSSLCDDVTPSYKTYPSDYPYEDFFTHSGQSAEDASVLNTSVICVRNEKRVSSSKLRLLDSLEEYDGIRIRKNVYEEALAKVEDERFEVDFAIETNASAMRQVQPLSEEVSMLKENEEKDNQPIGRLHYQVRPSHSLLSTHIGAIARLYGEQGDEVIHHLIRNPISVLPIVFKRLKDKDAEWRKIRVELTKQWRTICEANYDASLDATSYFHKRDIEKCFSHDSLVEECKRAFHYMKKPKEISKATESIAPSFSACHADSSMLLFHSHLSVNATQSMPYKDIYDCLAIQIQNFPAKTHVEKEKVSRIWTEFIAPWFNLPFYWFLNELRDKARSDKSPTIVKYAPEQKVKTVFGEGKIIQYNEGNNSVASHYEVSLPFGQAYIRPSAIVHHITSEVDFIRQNGCMEILRNCDEATNEVVREIPPSCQLLFGTEKVYFFMRLFCSLLGLFESIRNTLSVDNDAMEIDRELVNRNSYQKFLSIVKEHASEEINHKMYELQCRRLTKNKCYELLAIPRLLEKCADILFKVAREDKLLLLYDFCKLNRKDPVLQRSRSFAVAEDASFRIQYNSGEGKIHFCYLPIEKDMLIAPRSSNGINSYVPGSPSPNCSCVGGNEDNEVASTTDKNNGNVRVHTGIRKGSSTDSDEEEPDNKRAKFS